VISRVTERAGDIGDIPVQGERDIEFVAAVVEHGVDAGRTHAIDAAAHDPLVKALQPAEPTAVLQVDEGGVNGILDW
jgi:hypothetical protein